jgi:hypothetical protein
MRSFLIFLATYQRKAVVVKTILPHLVAPLSADFITEAEIVKKLGVHPNVVRLIGYHKVGFPGEGPIICLGVS